MLSKCFSHLDKLSLAALVQTPCVTRGNDLADKFAKKGAQLHAINSDLYWLVLGMKSNVKEACMWTDTLHAEFADQGKETPDAVDHSGLQVPDTLVVVAEEDGSRSIWKEASLHVARVALGPIRNKGHCFRGARVVAHNLPFDAGLV